jgi:hypothetical protein
LVLTSRNEMLAKCSMFAPFAADGDEAENEDGEDNKRWSNRNGYDCGPEKRRLASRQLAIANGADLDKPWAPVHAVAIVDGVELAGRHLLGLDSPPPTESKSETWRFPWPSSKSNATWNPQATLMMYVNVSMPWLA